MQLTSDILANLSLVSKAQGFAGSEIETPEILLPTISLSQVPQLATGVIGRTFTDSFLNDSDIAQTNVAASSTVLLTLARGFWHVTWFAKFFRNFVGADGDRFSICFTVDSGVNFCRFTATDVLTAGTEVLDRGEFFVQVSQPSLQIVGFVPTSVGVGNRVKLTAGWIGRKLV